MPQTPRIDFFVVAAARSGTTWLYVCLKDHPQICLTKKKEFDPFDKNGVLVSDDLREQFSDCRNASALRGVMPVFYAAQNGSSALVKKHFPKAKILMFLRNPIERAYSQYKHNIARGVVENMTFGESLRANAVHLEYGLYADAVESYRQEFGNEQVLIILHDEMLRDHAGTLTAVQKFLGIKQLPSSHAGNFVSVSREGRHSYNSRFLLRLHRLLVRLSAAARTTLGPWVGSVSRFLRLDVLLTGIARINYNKEIDMGVEQNMEATRLLPEDRFFLSEYYAGDIAKLAILLGKPLEWH